MAPGLLSSGQSFFARRAASSPENFGKKALKLPAGADALIELSFASTKKMLVRAGKRM